MSTLRKQPEFPGLAIHPDEFATPHPQEATSHTWDGILNNTGGGTLSGTFAPIDNNTWSSLGDFTTSCTGSSVNLV